MTEPAGRDPAPHRVVPTYALTGGRVRAWGADVPLESLVATTSEGLRAMLDLRFERRSIVLLCRKALSVAEVAARIGVPLGVARVLVSDLAMEGHLAVHVPGPGERPDRVILERLLSGLRAR